MSMSKFEDHLWREFVREHGDDLAQLTKPASGHALRRPRLAAGAGLGLAGGATALALVLTATSAPAFAVTRNQNGTVTVTIRSASGMAGANARLQQLGIRAQVIAKAPVGCSALPNRVLHFIPAAGARAQWTINPTAVPANHVLVLTPPLAGNSGNGNSGSGTGNSGSGNSGTGNSGTGNSGSGGGGQTSASACSVFTPKNGASTGNSGTGNSGTGSSGTGNSGAGA
jgi:hypothetical protein